MTTNSLTDKQTLKTKIRAAAGRCATIGALASVALLCAPFVNPPRQEPVATPAMPEPANPQSRIGVTLRTGDTLGSVLKQFGVAPPSAYAMIDKLRTFVDPKKFCPGDNIHVVLNAEDRTVEAMELVVDDDLVRVKATGDGWSAERQEISSVQETRVIRGVIKGSLYEAVSTPDSRRSIFSIWRKSLNTISIFCPISSAATPSARSSKSAIIVTVAARSGASLAAELEAGGETFDAFTMRTKTARRNIMTARAALRRSFLRAPSATQDFVAVQRQSHASDLSPNATASGHRLCRSGRNSGGGDRKGQCRIRRLAQRLWQCRRYSACRQLYVALCAFFPVRREPAPRRIGGSW